RGGWGVLALFGVVTGGVDGGAFTATEAAGVGAGGAFLAAAFRRTLGGQSPYAVLGEASRTTGMLFLVLFGALVFSNFISLSGFPDQLGLWVKALDVPPWVVIVAILGCYLALGCLLETLSMLLPTVPIFYP